jgi:hypothetical protein
MAPLTKDQKKALLKSALALLAVAAVSMALLLVNKPREKPVRFDASCKSFTAPIPLTLKLHEGPGEVQEATAEGFDATIANMASASLTVEGNSLGDIKAQGFKLERVVDPNQTPSHLDVTPNGGFGIAKLDVSSGALISSFATADAGPWVNAELPKANLTAPQNNNGSTLEMTLVAPVSTLKGNRYSVTGITLPKLPKRVVENFQINVKGEIPGAMLALKSRDPGAATKVWFRPVSEQVPLFEGTPEEETEAQSLNPQPSEATVGAVNNLPLLLHGCVNPDLRIENKTATGVIADRATDLKIQAISGTIEEIAILASADKNNAPRLRVRGRALASSMQQDEHELLPTRVGEAMDLPYAERGVALIILGFALFIAFKIVDRTLGVLLEYFFPKV